MPSLTRRVRNLRRQPTLQTRRRLLLETLENRSLLAAIAPPDDLVSWWTGDNTAADLAGAHNGTLSGGTTFAPGKVGQAFKLDGVNDTVMLAGTFGGGPEATIEAWVKSTGSTGDFQAIVSAVESYFVHLQLGTYGNNVAYTDGDVVGFPIISPTPQDEYRHIAMSLTSGDSRLYVNGDLVGTSPVTYSTLRPTSNLRIGSGYLGGRFFKGEIDEVSYYDRALSESEIQNIYRADSDGKIKSPTYIAADFLNVAEGDPGSTTVATFAINRVGNLASPAIVDWATIDGSANAGADYVAASGQVTFNAWETQKPVQVTVNGDSAPESNESFELVLSTTAPGYAVGGGLATIQDDDVGVSISDAAGTEGSTATKFLDTFVSANSGGLARAGNAVFGPDGQLYVVSRDNDSVLRYDGATGAFMDVVVPNGAEGLDQPWMLTFGPDDRLYVAGIDSKNVVRFDPVTGGIDTFVATGAGLWAPKGMVFDEAGTIYISNADRGTEDTSPDQDQVRKFAGPFGGPNGEAPGTFLGVFISQGSGGLNNPNHLAFHGDHMYVTNTRGDSINRYDAATGAFVDVFVPANSGGLDIPNYVVFRPDGYLYVNSQGTDEVLRYDAASGAFVDVIIPDRNPSVEGPLGLDFDADGNLYVAKGGTSEVLRYGTASQVAFIVSLSIPSATEVTVEYASSPGTAANDDYASSTGTITFAPGETARTILVQTLDDTTGEPSETFTVNLANAVGAVFVDGSGTATITDDDATRLISISDATATEGSTAGRFLDTFVAPGSGGLAGPHGFALGSDGLLYVASMNTDEVLRYDDNGAFVDAFVSAGSGGLDAPYGVAFGPDGNLYVSSRRSDQILRYSSIDGSLLGAFTTGRTLEFPGPIAFGPDNALYVTSETGITTSEIVRFNALSGAFINVIAASGTGGLDDPRGLALGPDGNLYVSEPATNSILRFNRTSGAFMGNFVPFGSGGLDDPREIAFGPDGNLYVAEYQTNGVLRYNGSTGAFLDVYVPSGAGGMNIPQGLAFGPDGNLFVGSFQGNAILRFGSASLAAFTVSLSSASGLPVAVNYATDGGSALAGSDYTDALRTITFAPGQTTQTILVQTLNDALVEPTETFVVNLMNPVGGVISDNQGVGTILDNDIPPTKFYVVNDGSPDRTYEYGASGIAVENYAVNSGNTAPRGAASTAAGDRVWVVDANRKVYVYNASGTLLGSWSAGSLGGGSTTQVQGIATNGTDIWIVQNSTDTKKADTVFRYANVASRLSGSQNAATNFNLNAANKNPTDIVTDGTSFWITNDTTATDQVFKYTVGGALLGSWTITDGGGSPTGITIDPASASNIWIVDNNTDTVYQFDNAASRTTGSQSPSASFALAAGNTNPQGIADPPAVVSGGTGGSPSNVSGSADSSFDAALLSLLADFDGHGLRKKRK